MTTDQISAIVQHKRVAWSAVGRLSIVVAVFAAVGIAKSVHIGIGFRDPHGQWLAHRVLYAAVLVVILVLADAWWRGGRRIGGVMPTLAARWSWGRAGAVLAALALYHATYFVYHNLKSWDVFNASQDAWLERVDRAMFFGHSPATLLHDLLGTHHAAYVLTAWYESFGTLVVFCSIACVIWCTRLRQGLVFLTSLAWVWIFGVACYYAIPSLGPFNESPQDFAALPHTVIQANQAKYMAQRAYLLADPSRPDAAAQVSAFASLHVGVSCVIWLMLGYYGYRQLFRAMGLYVALTVVATIYLGWHFVLDDIAGFLIAAAAIWCGRKTIYPHLADELADRGLGEHDWRTNRPWRWLLGGATQVPVAGRGLR